MAALSVIWNTQVKEAPQTGPSLDVKQRVPALPGSLSYSPVSSEESSPVKEQPVVAQQRSRCSSLPVSRLAEVDSKVQDLCSKLKRESSGVWQVTAPLSVGKSTLLKELKKSLSALGLCPILLAPPAGHMDSAVVALCQLAGQLAETHDPSLLGLISNPEVAFEQKVRSIRFCLRAHYRNIVALCDEPNEWLPRTPERKFFSRPLEVIERLFFGPAKIRVVVAGSMLPGAARPKQTIEFSPHFDPEIWLTESEDWPSEFAEMATQLFDMKKLNFKTRTPLELRLLVGLLAMGKPASSFENWTRRSLSYEFKRQAQSDSKWRSLLAAWARLSLLRGSFSADALSCVEAPEEDTMEGQILRNCLLYKTDDGYVLHELLRSDISGELSKEEETKSHRDLLSDYYLPKSECAASAEESVRFDVECFHHAAASGNLEVALQKAYLCEQLKILGRYLSKEHGRFADAATVFQTAIKQENDAYAHHYYAFNLDVLAESPEVVEEHYRESLQSRPREPLWWSHFISFLLIRGRTLDAENQWNLALDTLATDLPEWEAYQFRALHGRLLSVALARSCLDFADRILETVSDDVLRRDPQFRAAKKRLRALRLGREGKIVVPYPLVCKNWWESGPFFLASSLENGSTLVRWLAARVENVDSENVELRLGEVLSSDPAEPRISFGDFPKQLLEEWGVDVKELKPGEFLELGAYGDDESIFRAVRHRAGDLAEVDLALQEIFPDPNRYLARA